MLVLDPPMIGRYSRENQHKVPASGRKSATTPLSQRDPKAQSHKTGSWSAATPQQPPTMRKFPVLGSNYLRR